MSSSNNNVVQNIENDAITISNEQNQSIQEEEENHQTTTTTAAAIPEPLSLFYRTMSFLNDWVSGEDFAGFFLSMYLLHMIGSYNIGVYYLFPVIYPIVSWILAYIGVWVNSDKLLIPCMFTAACEMIYAIICVTFLISFHVRDDEFLLNKFLYDHWPETAKKFDKVSRDDYYFVMSLIYCSTSIMAGYVVISVLNVQFTQMRVEFVEQQISEINEERGLVLVKTQLLQNLTQLVQDQASKIVSLQEENITHLETLTQQLRALILNAEHERSQNPFANLLAEFPPPPSYESERVLLSPPQNGLPPPAYSMLERSPSTDLQQSIDNQSSSDTAVPEIYDSNDTSSNESLNESTAMSPS